MKSKEEVQAAFRRGVSGEKEVKMKCPLLTIGWSAAPGGVDAYPADCFRRVCAWWDKDNAQCVVTTLGKGIWILDQLVTGIVNKMPHA